MRAAELRAEQTALERTEHGALLALYAAEAALGRAQSEQHRLDARSLTLAREESLLRRRTDAVAASLAASQARVARTLRELYVYGEADPIAAVLGATSVDEALAAIDSLERAAEQNTQLAAEARARATELAELRGRLGLQRVQLDEARAAGEEASRRLEQAASERGATVSGIRRRNARAAARIDQLLARARAAVKASQVLISEAASTARSEPTPPAVAPAQAEATGLPAMSGTRTLVVSAVAYHLSGRTASGLPVGAGVVAVDPSVIPLGTRLFIPGYGPGIAADTGSAVKGSIIDLWMPSTAAARRWGRQTVTITIYG